MDRQPGYRLCRKRRNWFRRHIQHQYDQRLLVRDSFDDLSYSGNNSTTAWTSDWQESGENDGANSGVIRVVSPDTSSTTIARSITQSSDDAEEEGPQGENFGPGGMYLHSSDLELVDDLEPSTSGTQKVGLRFNNLDIPPGSLIVGAFHWVQRRFADAKQE